YFAKHRLFTGINVIGLALGLAAFLLMQAYIRFERSYDAYFSDSEDIYRVSVHSFSNGGEVKDAMMYHPAARAMEDELPEVIRAGVVLSLDETSFRMHGEPVYESGVLWADSTFLHMFDYKVVYGRRADMLNKPNQVVLTESKARAYFGNENPIGQTMEALSRGNLLLTVSGVIEDVPDNTHLKFDMLVSDATFVDRFDYGEWNWNNHYVYLQLQPGTDPADLEPKFDQMIRKYHEVEEGDKLTERWVAMKVSDIHLQSDYTYETEAPGNARSIQVIQIIALFILIIAWVNYINLTTARAVDRAKEVGLRKVVGAVKVQLIVQFFIDAMLVNAVAAVLAVGLAELVLPMYHRLVGIELYEHVFNNFTFLQQVGLFFLLGTFITGAYPSLVLSRFTPAVVLKGKYQHSRQGLWLRKGLVTLQFATSLVLIAGSLLVYQQMQFLRKQDRGLDANYVVGLQRANFNDDEDDQTDVQRFESMRDILRQHSSIVTVGGAESLPGSSSTDLSS
ncbi:MAG TPA: hypothetical protein DCR93_02515, partial [Cytophagales bacterium]|nr:hypothetical protein [Cytophagales bacterium]